MHRRRRSVELSIEQIVLWEFGARAAVNSNVLRRAREYTWPLYGVSWLQHLNAFSFLRRIMMDNPASDWFNIGIEPLSVSISEFSVVRQGGWPTGGGGGGLNEWVKNDPRWVPTPPFDGIWYFIHVWFLTLEVDSHQSCPAKLWNSSENSIQQFLLGSNC